MLPEHGFLFWQSIQHKAFPPIFLCLLNSCLPRLIWFVAYNHDSCLWWNSGQYQFLPISNPFKWLLRSDISYYDGKICMCKVYSSFVLKLLLTISVPNLELNWNIWNGDVPMKLIPMVLSQYSFNIFSTYLNITLLLPTREFSTIIVFRT